ncbi:MAG: hypothetical protein HC803_09885 [Saprospiraceae bacterium]|nr:hypothetical protein [Saprospiraceae bacterium]
MEKETIKLYLNQMTQTQMYELFGIARVRQMNELDEWITNLPDLTEEELNIINFYQKKLIENIDSWNEQELSLGFIGPIININNYKVDYKLNFFAQRQISAVVGDYELIGKPDGMIASGLFDPRKPYFNFQEYKRDMNSSGDPAGQNVAAMLVGQTLNEESDLVYGCYIAGRLWYFMILKGKEYAISKSFNADDEDIYDIVKVLKKLKYILFERLGITETA